jgi:hypothetical protein
VKVRWIHELPDEPVLLYSEIDDQRTELRKVEEYRDGRLDAVNAVSHTGSMVLSATAMPSLAEINAQSEFHGEPMSEDELEQVWDRAWQWFDD